jgi:Uma2 family endonuclease
MIQPLTPVVGDDDLYEVINGEKVIKPMSTYENVLAGNLFAHVHAHATAHDLGRAVIEVLFDLPNVDNNRRPDVAFVSFARWPASRRPPRQAAWQVVPELAAEVVSPTDDMDDVMDRVEEYFRAGITLVWLMLPLQERVYVYTSPTAVRILSRADELTGDPILPGFRLRLADLFPPPDPPAENGP